MSSSHEWEEYSVKSGWSNPTSAIDALAPALVAAQGQIEGATKGKKNDHFRSKYADLGAVWDACREALQANGIAVVQLPTVAPPGHVGLKTILIHKTGQSIQDTFYMPLKDATNPQAAGSALTYARRYALSAAIGICPVDDDGNAASAAPKPPPAAKPAKDWSSLKVDMLRQFDEAVTKDAKKTVFMATRASEIPEPDKTNLLTQFGTVIKGMK